MKTRLKLLILEDEPNDATLEIAILEQAGYLCDWERVESRASFTERLETQSYDVILSDYALPGFDGMAALAHVLQQHIDIPFIFVSGTYGEELAIESLKAGATDYVLKNRMERLVPVVARALKEHTDLLERQRAENELRQYKTIVSNAADLLALIDCSYIFLAANAAYLRHIHKKSEDVIGHSVSEVFGEHFFKTFLQSPIAVCMKGEEVRYQDWIDFPSVGRKYMDVIYSPYKGEKNVVSGTVVCARDISDRKRAEEEHVRLMAAIEQAAEEILITDAAGCIVYVNPAFELVTGFSRQEVLGKNPRFLKSGKQKSAFYDNMWRTLLKGETWTGRFINKNKDGLLFTEDATISPVRDNHGVTVNYVAVKRDISQEICMEEQLRQALKMEAVGQLAGGIAHDFNNILQAILGYGDIAMARLKQDDKTLDYVKEMIKAGKRAAILVGQLLAFSRRQVLRMESLNLNDTVSELMKMIGRVIGEHISLEYALSPDIAIVSADRGQIEQIVINLCVNARDAMPDGGTICIQTQNIHLDDMYCAMHNGARQGDYVQLSITDTGSGMDQSITDQIFEPFFTTKEVGRGTGLGLATVYGLVKQHNGLIEVYSELNKGTTFKIYLPIVEHASSAAHTDEKKKIQGGTETILLAEDDEIVRGVCLHMLLKAGYKVLPAADGEDALHVFKAHSDEIDLAMLDVVMPRMGGNAVYDQMMKIRPKLKVVFTSGYNADAIHSNFVLNDRITLITKPYMRDDLLVKIREALDSPGDGQLI